MTSSRDFVRPGQQWEPPRADLQNAWTEAALRQPQLALPRTNRFDVPQSIRINVRLTNTQASNDIIGFGDPLRIATSNSEAQEVLIFDQALAVAGRFVVVEQGARQDEVAKGVLTGVTWAEVNVTDTAHTHADVNGAILQSGTSGYAKILYKPAGTGTNWCCLYLGCCESGSDSSSGIGDQCICDLIDALEDEGSLSAGAASTLRATCNCATFQACASCNDGQLADSIPASFAGWTADSGPGGAAEGPNFAAMLATAAAAINTSHDIDVISNGCSRTKEIHRETRNTSGDDETATATVTITHAAGGSSVGGLTSSNNFFYVSLLVSYVYTPNGGATVTTNHLFHATLDQDDCHLEYSLASGDWSEIENAGISQANLLDAGSVTVSPP